MAVESSPAASIDALAHALQGVGYHAPRSLVTAVFLALKLQRPLLLEGEPGVGKTELAKALSAVLSRPLLRLQCYDGMEQREALYEWNHTGQLLHMNAARHSAAPDQIEREVYQERYLIRRPLLQALQQLQTLRYGRTAPDAPSLAAWSRGFRQALARSPLPRSR